ncbi:DNA internalization-related competence protein ComEC/Rec2 [Caldimonas thermodepolymerans]|uniref:DNA internalization-related competence protein ComEC/Rec2 n=1 Tax=Caldimonas thermodepolymerans TaxID=215580 RepID=A0A2S5T1U3_9BURK|nr:DNA internalization-related competence protein ComEC/Rec2 [Caldimonas thermodepolymerans]PPE68899.1 DNA internalization-related competence protein ComEC/Rec2 [Caldimonas thermodepolymerans]QPC30400.1 DNA internalization-related competence protein ComEC/Rec2 [Caldimonas thermodepolymerans]RDI03024.1 competence protein ComEC [Caldimonas thermodepolymerans]
MREEAGSGPAAWVVSLGIVLGAALQLQERALWAGVGYALAALAAVALLAVLAWWRPRRHVPAALLAALALGWGGAGWQAQQRLAERLAPALEGVDLDVVGVVAAMPRVQPSGIRFRFAIESAHDTHGPVPVPREVLLGWYTGWREGGPAQGRPPVELKAGQRWQLRVRLRQPHGNLNPHGFDYELWLFEQGIGATGYVRDTGAAPPRLLDAAVGHPVERWRQAVRDAIHAQVDDERAAGVLAALVTGDQAAIDRDDWEVFRITGVAHLMAISGLHVTMFAWLAAAVLRRLWRCSARLMLALPAPVAARWGGLALAAAYAVFAGWGVPAQRTVLMLGAVTLLAQAGRQWPWPAVLCATAAVVTLCDPWALLQPGFWLSFVAVALLMATDADQVVAATWRVDAGASLWRRLRGQAWASVRGMLRTQLVATVGLAPLTMAFFHQVSLVGLLANLVAIPLVTLAITPLGLLGVLAPPLWTLGAACVEGLGALLQAMAGWPAALWLTAAGPGWAVAAAVAGGVLVVLPLPWRVRLLALPLLLPLAWPAPPRPPAGSFELLAVDVGQGTAVLVRTARHTLLYDAGPQYSPDSDAGQRVLLPLLRALGERRIDRLVLSHRDVDHVGGARAVLQAYPEAQVTSSLEAGHPLLQGRADAVHCAASPSWTWDGVHFEMLHPGPDEHSPPLKPNQVSCVLKVSGGGHAALLTGDIERREEARLVVEQAGRLRADLLLVPHHGSKTSSSAGFLDAVAPRVAVIQAGYRNRFGHPAAPVLARYAERGIEVVASPACGAYRWFEGDGVCERDLRRRYWHHGGVNPALQGGSQPVEAP